MSAGSGGSGPGMGADPKSAFCTRHDVPLPCRFCGLERYVLQQQQQQQQQEQKRQEEQRRQQRQQRPTQSHRAPDQPSVSTTQQQLQRMQRQQLHNMAASTFDPHTQQQQQQLQLQELQNHIQRQTTTQQHKANAPKVLHVIQDTGQERIVSNNVPVNVPFAGSETHLKVKQHLAKWQKQREMEQFQQQPPPQAQVLKGQPGQPRVIRVPQPTTEQPRGQPQQRLQTRQVIVNQFGQTPVTQPSTRQQPRMLPDKPGGKPLYLLQLSDLDETSQMQVKQVQEGFQPIVSQTNVQDFNVAQQLKVHMAQQQHVQLAGTAPHRVPYSVPTHTLSLSDLSCKFCGQPDHTECPLALQSHLYAVTSSEQRVRLMIEVAESIIHQRSAGIHTLILQEWRGRGGVEAAAETAQAELRARLSVLELGMESALRQRIAQEESVGFMQLLEQYMCEQCTSWDQWILELRKIQQAARSGNPSPQHGRRLQLLEAFIQSSFHVTLSLPGSGSRWYMDSLHRAVARALHLAICEIGDHAGYGVTCAYCAAGLRCISSEQVHRESLAQLAWSPSTHPRFPVPFRAAARAVVLSASRMYPGLGGASVFPHVMAYLPPADLPRVIEPMDAAAVADMGCKPCYHPGSRRCMSLYNCACGASWRSAHTWPGQTQHCLACGQQVSPMQQDPLWLRSAVVDIPASYPNCLVVISSSTTTSKSYPFIEEEAELDVFSRFGPKPIIHHLHSNLELEAQLLYATEAEALQALKAVEREYYLCGANGAFLLPCLDDPCTLRLARVPESVDAMTVSQDFSYLARLAAEDCMPQVTFVPYVTPGYNTACIKFAEPNIAAEVFFQYHCQLDETTELADCRVCQELGFSCTIDVQLHGASTQEELILQGVPPFMSVDDIADIFMQLQHPPIQVVRRANLYSIASVIFLSSTAAKAAHAAFHAFVAQHTSRTM